MIIINPFIKLFDADDAEESEKATHSWRFEQLEATFAADIINQGNSKLEGIAESGKNMVSSYPQPSPMAFGNQDNDLECWRVSSVAAGNGGSSAVPAAILLCNQQDGIYKAPEHFGVGLQKKCVCQSRLPL